MVSYYTVVFRVDASLVIGSGHVMRCLTLADALLAIGAECHFICKKHVGHLEQLIQSRGHKTHLIDITEGTGSLEFAKNSEYTHWLGTTQEQDARECAELISIIRPDWLIVDHYALDAFWEKRVKMLGCNLLVIDDLANRTHNCDVLLDQTYGRDIESYRSLVPESCILLCGSQYALLRPDFKSMRLYSLNRRRGYELKTILISLGGVDVNNITAEILNSLKSVELPETCKITVVMGPTAPWLHDVQKIAASLPWSTEVKVNVAGMARLMSESDFAIGAAGSTSWERCCLGLPTAMIVTADNQNFAADLLEQAVAVVRLSTGDQLTEELVSIFNKITNECNFLRVLSECSQQLVNGNGCEIVVENMLKISGDHE